MTEQDEEANRRAVAGRTGRRDTRARRSPIYMRGILESIGEDPDARRTAAHSGTL